MTKENEMETELVEVKISKVLCASGWTPYILTCRTHKIKNAYEKFSTLSKLKNYYEIKKVTRTSEKEWAISSRGKRYEWLVYKAYISPKFVV